MWKQFVALARGHRHDAATAVLDASAHVILRQQIRDVAATLEQARLAVAVVVVQERDETRRVETMGRRRADLEERAVAALDKGEAALAREAAEAIARLEAELASAEETKSALAAEIGRLRMVVGDAEARLVALRRGQRLAEAAGRVAHLRHSRSGEVTATLRDAEATLQRLRERQTEADAIDRALDESAGEPEPGALSRKLAEAGCGAPLPHSADAVLKRLNERRRAAGA